MHLVKLLRLKRLLCSLQMVAASQLFILLALVSRSEYPGLSGQYRL